MANLAALRAPIFSLSTKNLTGGGWNQPPAGARVNITAEVALGPTILEVPSPQTHVPLRGKIVTWPTLDETTVITVITYTVIPPVWLLRLLSGRRTRWFLSARPVWWLWGVFFWALSWPRSKTKSRGDRSGLLAGHGCLARRLMASPEPALWPASGPDRGVHCGTVLLEPARATYSKAVAWAVACICASRSTFRTINENQELAPTATFYRGHFTGSPAVAPSVKRAYRFSKGTRVADVFLRHHRKFLWK